MNNLIFHILLSICLIFSLACKREGEVSWSADHNLPLAQGKLSIENLVPDSLIESDAGNALSLVYRDEILTRTTNNLFTIPDTTFSKTVTLKQLELGNRVIEQEVTLEQVASEAGSQGEIIIQNDGKKLPIPELNSISIQPTEISATDFFESAEFKSGELVISLENNFPVDLTDVAFVLRNKNDQAIIATDTIAIIPKNTTREKAYDLSGKSVEGTLIAEILSISSPGSNGQQVNIDLDDALVIRLSPRNTSLISANAIFPAQNLVDDSMLVIYKMKPLDLDYLKIKSGELRITTVHTLPEPSYLDYKLPAATANGEPLNINYKIDPSPNGDSVFISRNIDLTGYDLDFTLQGEFKNAFLSLLKLRIDSTGEKVFLSLRDSLQVKYGLYNIKVAEANGAIGKDTIRLDPIRQKIDLFNSVKSGAIEFSKAQLGVSFENAFDIPIQLKIDEISAFKSRNNKSLVLKSNEFSEINIPASPNFPYENGTTDIKINESTSNAEELISLNPDFLSLSGKVLTSPDNLSNPTQLTDSNYLRSFLDLKVPLRVRSKKLVLIDTAEFNIAKYELEEKISKLRLKAKIKNSLPLNLKLKITFLNELYNRVYQDDQLIEIEAADDNLSPERLIDLNYNQEVSRKILTSRYILLEAELTTLNQDFGQLYSTQFFDFKLNLEASILNSIE